MLLPWKLSVAGSVTCRRIPKSLGLQAPGSGLCVEHLKVLESGVICTARLTMRQTAMMSCWSLQEWGSNGTAATAREGCSTASPAGTIFLTIYSIWHRRGRATAEGTAYKVDVAQLRLLRPTVLVVQDLCRVCAVSPEGLRGCGVGGARI